MMDQVQQVQLMQDSFSPAEAAEAVLSIIDKQINFYKLQHLSHWESNHHLDASPYMKKVAELGEKKDRLKAVLSKAKASGQRVMIDGVLELKLMKNQDA